METELNAIICHACAWVCISTHRHHMAWCLCGDVAADGGGDYARISWMPGAEYTVVTSFADANEWIRLREADWWAAPPVRGLAEAFSITDPS